MPRQARLDVPGALHHIMVRGIAAGPNFGLTAAAIARHVGVSTSAITRAIERVGESADR